MKEERKEIKPQKTSQSINGHSFGTFQLGKSKLMINQGDQRLLSINYADVQNATSTLKDEILIEFNQDDNRDLQGTLQARNGVDQLCEMRLVLASKGNKKEEGYEEEEKEAESLVKELAKRANLDTYSGNDITRVSDIQMLIPRGHYSIIFYEDFLRLHGSTHDTKTSYKYITRCFLLDLPGFTHKAFVVALSRGIRIGNTQYPFIVMKIKEEVSVDIKINLEREEVLQRFGTNLEKQIKDGNILEGELYHNMAALFATLVKTKVIITGDHYKSTNDEQCLRCSVKAQEGLLYPLVKSVLFIHKPVVYIKHDEIKEVRMTRLEFTKMKTVRTFDVQIICKNGNQYEFTQIKTDEFEGLQNYFQKAELKILTEDISKIGNDEKNLGFDVGEYEDDDESDEEYVQGQESGEDDDDDDDQDFNESDAQD